MGKHFDDIPDEPSAPSAEQLFIARVRSHARALRLNPISDKTVLALYHVPGYVRCGIEALANEATGGTIEPAATCLIETGLPIVRHFKDVAEITEARRILLTTSDAVAIASISELPTVSIDACDTDDTDAL